MLHTTTTRLKDKALNKNKIAKVIARFCTPQPITSIYYLFKYGALVSHKAEVDLTANLRFGRKCVVGSFTKIKAMGGPLIIGDRGGIATNCFLSVEHEGMKIGENFICGPNVNIVGSNYDLSKKGIHLEDLEVRSRGISIGDNVWIGAGSTILDGTILGDNTIVVANSLVNRRYPGDVILQGNPAKIIMRR